MIIKYLKLKHNSFFSSCSRQELLIYRLVYSKCTGGYITGCAYEVIFLKIFFQGALFQAKCAVKILLKRVGFFSPALLRNGHINSIS
ncbi:hypothetical protein C1N53_11795 [Pontibacter sp. SGAir0037]|nr:hypothetical protein C1N53_11795 [Pontibacter sp. SGAir0037]